MRSVLIALAIGLLLGCVFGQWVEGRDSAAKLANLKAQHASDRTRQAEAHTQAITNARTEEQTHAARLQTALNDSRSREAGLRRAAAAVRAELVGLRDASDEALRVAGTSHAACLDRAAAFRAVHDACTADLEDIARKADRHADDARTLIEAWPRK